MTQDTVSLAEFLKQAYNRELDRTLEETLTAMRNEVERIIAEHARITHSTIDSMSQHLSKTQKAAALAMMQKANEKQAAFMREWLATSERELRARVRAFRR